MSDPSPPSGQITFTDRQTEMIIAALTERKAASPCPRCKNPTFNVGRGGFVNFPTSRTTHDQFSEWGIPAVVTTCTRCGYLSFHAAGILGFLNNPEFEAAADASDADRQ